MTRRQMTSLWVLIFIIGTGASVSMGTGSGWLGTAAALALLGIHQMVHLEVNE